jgi:hypothetical protein
MGQTQSASLPSKEEILRKTKGGTSLVNTLFQWMVSQASIRDFYLMANPAQCRKYIMLTADVLNKVFHKIDVIPKEGAKGTIYFQKVDTLNPQDKGDPMYKHREINCLRLAFLFVRIFQVFAALSLSILDVEPELEMKLIADVTRLQGSQSIPLFGARQAGGALNAKKYLHVGFEPFRAYLNEVPTRPDYYQLVGTQVFLKHSAPLVDSSLPVTYYYAITKKNGKTESGQINGSLGAAQDGDDSRLLVRLTSLKKTTGTTTESLDNKTIRFTMNRIGEPYRDKGQRLIPQGISNAFDSLARGDTEEKNGETSNSGKSKEKSSSITQFEKDMGEVAEGLHTKTIVSAFTRVTPPKTHCIARALQLLSDSGLQASFPKEIYSHICKTKFLVDSRSLPPANERITKEDGIYALAQLFYDTLKESTPTISEKTQDQYKSFVTKMKFVFEEQKNAKVSIADIRKNPLDEVVNKIPSAVCDSKVVDKTLKTSNREVIRQLRDNVRRMIQYQIGHTANVVKILRKLFLLPVESGKSLQIHPRVLKYGMDEVNALAEEARNLLIDYYSQCEILYRSGAEIIAASKSNMTAL